jgi:hypothetical protein
MSVDGIGGGGRNVGGPGPLDGAGAPNSIEGARDVGRAGEAERAAATGALERLGRGEITLDQYLDGRVAEAIEHLQGRVPPGQIDFVRAALRESLASDPVLLELVRRATGLVPPPQAE